MRLVFRLTLAAALISAPVWGQADPGALFDQGVEDMRKGNYQLGCAAIKGSLELDRRPGTMFTLAECYRLAGKFASAVELYDEYLALHSRMSSKEQAQQGARATISEEERGKLLPRVPWVTVVLPSGAPDGVVITLDDRPFAKQLVGKATAIDPGRHYFTVWAPGRERIQEDIDIGPGQRITVDLDVPPLSDSPNTENPDEFIQEPQPDEPPPHSLTPWFYVAGGIGVAGLATGAVAGVMLLNERQKIFDECEGTQCSPDGKEAADLAQNTLAPVTTVALGVGVAGVIVAVVLLVADSSEAAPTAARVTPMIAAGSGRPQLGVQGTF